MLLLVGAVGSAFGPYTCSAHTETALYATTVATVTGWDFETQAQGSGSTCDASHTALQRNAFSPNTAYLIATAFSSYTLPANEYISKVEVDVDGGNDANSGTGSRFGIRTSVSGATPTQTSTWSENSLVCQWRLSSTPAIGGHGLDIASFLGGAGNIPASAVNSFTVQVRRGNVGNNDLRVSRFRIYVTTETIQYTINASASAGGSISPSGSVVVNSGSSQSLAITANACYHIADVVVDGGSVGAVGSFNFTNVTANHSISASFAINTYALTYTAGANGTISGTSPQTVNCGSNGTAVTAVPNACYSFVNWSDGSTSNPRTDTNVQANKSVTANFAINTYTLTYTAGTNGTLTGTSPQTANCGANGAAVTAVPNACYQFGNWSDGSTANPRTDTNVQANLSVTANFIIKTLVVTASAGTGGTISPSGGVSVACGASQSFTVAASTCHHIADVVVDGASVGAVGSFNFTNVTQGHLISASFAIDGPYSISASAGPGGLITPSGNAVVNCSDSLLFTITPNTPYLISDVMVDGISTGSVSSYSFTNVTASHTIAASFRLPAPAISAIEPNAGGNTGPVTVIIRGRNFRTGLTAFLSSSQIILATNVVVAGDSTSLTATFDLSGVAVGAWDVGVTNTDNQSGSLPGSFTVTTVQAPQLRVSILGPSLIRANRRTAFDLVLENAGNVDALDVPLWISGIPADATVEPGFAIAAPTRSGGEPAWATVPLGFTGASGRYVPVVIPRVPPGTIVRRVYLTIPMTDPSFHLRAAITPPWADGTVFRSCLSAAGITNTACMGAQLTAINDSLDTSAATEALSGVGVWAKIAWDCESAGTLPAALTKAQQVLDFMLAVIETQAGLGTACGPALAPRWTDTLIVTIVGSLDPNEKLGGHNLIAVNEPVPYSIRFENAHTATAPAQDVVVVDQLDQTKLDLSTVRFNDITFSGRKLIVPPDIGAGYSTSISLSASLRVDVSILLDRFTGLLTWSFASIDPATNATPTNPLIGFLPPDSTGSVLFTVVPRSTLAGGTSIVNSAAITFDNNAPNRTPAWTYIVDNVPPTSHVLPLVAASNATSIPVSWTADGSPLDLKDFTIYVSEDNAPYRVWRQDTRATADTLSPPGNHRPHSYKFYSSARDSSGNIEASPGAADASTQSVLAVDGAAPSLQLALEGARPNPTTGAMRVWFTLPTGDAAALELIDIAGRLVMRRDVGSLGPGTHSVALDTPRPLLPGLYFVRLSQGSRVLGARVAVVR